MNSILKSFTIGDLLRNLFSGVFSVVSYVSVTRSTNLVDIVDAKSIFTIAVPVSLFVGVIVYSLHRSLIYPCIECFFDSRFFKKLRKRISLLRKSSIEIILWRWGQEKFSKKIELEKVNDNLNKWADYIHLQYSSSLCTVAGMVVGSFENHNSSSNYWPLIFIVFLLFCAAFVSDWRLHSLIDHVREKRT